MRIKGEDKGAVLIVAKGKECAGEEGVDRDEEGAGHSALARQLQHQGLESALRLMAVERGELEDHRAEAGREKKIEDLRVRAEDGAGDYVNSVDQGLGLEAAGGG